ncbi:uncharacterized protein MONBRDRAFT_33462 [Monosiga brevicollis MX1]|uniref:Uncharacterized protein n=1 Tax=Monosiga brevicollis TaxID=81824 RepID=A9V5I6_MONBE|nr:uncharacterized protein MONBRDRAFT_33462 [Monosiga brevicollis MX1]EDQ87376.1 predicted protein [Monosiga brevicollis MX1]|eukprot:XP_001747989.1 hypothetical protein [Monosiga brevicollis MX1]
MGIVELYQLACEFYHLTPLEAFTSARLDTASRTLRLRGKGSLQPNLPPIQINDEHCQALGKALRDDTSVTVLDLRYNAITDKGAEALAEMLEMNRTIKTLLLDGNDIQAEGAGHLALAFQMNETVQRLGLSHNRLGSEGNLALANMLQVNHKLTALNVAQTDNDITSCIAYFTVLRTHPSLQEVNLSRPNLFSTQEETAVHAAEMLLDNTVLKTVVLQKHGITDFGAARLAQSLQKNTSLQGLDLRNNRIGPDGVAELGRALARQETGKGLRFLDLGYNRAQTLGVEELLPCLLKTNLKAVSLEHNEIDSQGVAMLAQHLSTQPLPDEMYLWGNPAIVAPNAPQGPLKVQHCGVLG